MSADTPSDRPSGPEPPLRVHRRYNPALIFGIPLFAVAAFYLALVVVTQLDDVFLPGNELGVPSVLPFVGEDDPEYASVEERINILVMGLDLRRDESDDTPGRTDSVFVLSMDPYSKTAGIFSIPRDLLVEIPNGRGGYTRDRINTAYEVGQYTYDDYPGGGGGLARDTVEHNFDIPIDHYVVLNFNNFIEIVDELGGVDVDVPEYAYDAAYNDCKRCPFYPVEFVPGTQHMDGETALAYARIRKSDNDFKRIERQQIVMRATAKKAFDLGILLDDPLGLYKKYKDSVKTDIGDFKAGGLALLSRQIGLDNIRMESIASATYPCPASACGGAAMLLADWDAVEEIKNRVFSDGRLQSEGAIVKVLNGTATPDLAQEFAAFLRAQGIPAEQISVDEYANGALYNSTLVVDLSGKTHTAQKLASWLALAETRIKKAADPEAVQFGDPAANVVVVLGADARVPQLPAARETTLPDYSDYAGEETAAPDEPLEPVFPTPEETEPPVDVQETPAPAPTEAPTPAETETPAADTTTAGGQ